MTNIFIHSFIRKYRLNIQGTLVPKLTLVQRTLVPKLTLGPLLTLSVRNGHKLKD